MRTEEYAYIVLTAAALIFPCGDHFQEKIVFRAAAQQRVTIGAVNPMPMISEQNSQMTASTTRTVIDRFNEAFNRHDADALAPLLTTPSSRTLLLLRTARGLRGRPRCSHSGGFGSRTTWTRASRRKT
jgi:hypothetical protein